MEYIVSGLALALVMLYIACRDIRKGAGEAELLYEEQAEHYGHH